MNDKLKKAKELLHKYNQEHLLQFYNELTNIQKSNLLNQILDINFEEILKLYDKSKFDVLDSTEEMEPLPYIDKSSLSQSKLNKYTSIGNKAIKSKKVGVITLAGGQGSRLRNKWSKGCFLFGFRATDVSF